MRDKNAIAASERVTLALPPLYRGGSFEG